MKDIIRLTKLLFIILMFVFNQSIWAANDEVVVNKGVEYKWKNISFYFPSSWGMSSMTSVNGIHSVMLNYKQSDQTSLTLVVKFVPQRSSAGKAFSTKVIKDNNYSALQYLYDNLGEQFSNMFDTKSSDSNMTVVNSIVVASTVTSGALIIAPAKDKTSFVSTQLFFLPTQEYYIFGGVNSVSTISNKKINSISSKKVNELYQILATINIEPIKKPE